jgi:hypothetical protein
MPKSECVNLSLLSRLSVCRKARGGREGRKKRRYERRGYLQQVLRSRRRTLLPSQSSWSYCEENRDQRLSQVEGRREGGKKRLTNSPRSLFTLRSISSTPSRAGSRPRYSATVRRRMRDQALRVGRSRAEASSCEAGKGQRRRGKSAH